MQLSNPVSCFALTILHEQLVPPAPPPLSRDWAGRAKSATSVVARHCTQPGKTQQGSFSAPPLVSSSN